MWSKLKAVTSAAVAACDAIDGVVDGVIRDPRVCRFDAAELTCTGSSNTSCLMPGEAKAVNRVWGGARMSEVANATLLWYGIQRGADLAGLAGSRPFFVAINQPKYW